MTDITSNITFDNENGKITKCVLQIGGKTFTVTLVNSGYNVEDGGNVTASSSSAVPDSSTSDKAANAANPANAAASTSTASTTSNPLEEVEYDTQEKLIEKLVQHGYTVPL